MYTSSRKFHEINKLILKNFLICQTAFIAFKNQRMSNKRGFEMLSELLIQNFKEKI